MKFQLRPEIADNLPINNSKVSASSKILPIFFFWAQTKKLVKISQNSYHLPKKGLFFFFFWGGGDKIIKCSLIFFLEWDISPQKDKNVNELISETTGSYAKFSIFLKITARGGYMNPATLAGRSAELAIFDIIFLKILKKFFFQKNDQNSKYHKK